MKARKMCLVLSLLSLFPAAAFSLPSSISAPGEKVIVVDTREHSWGAYTPNGQLIHSGIVGTGKSWCADMNMPCPTSTGSFRIRTLGSAGCKSPSFPLPKGGAPMPYCMYYTRLQALHGYPHVEKGNVSHGCVRMTVSDARWIRFNFAEIGTLVYIQ